MFMLPPLIIYNVTFCLLPILWWSLVTSCFHSNTKCSSCSHSIKCDLFMLKNLLLLKNIPIEPCSLRKQLTSSYCLLWVIKNWKWLVYNLLGLFCFLSINWDCFVDSVLLKIRLQPIQTNIQIQRYRSQPTLHQIKIATC